ncbi:RNA polymerase subunit sigma-70 [Lampropedia aestuarii]|uniref:RNA polymerase subunit sigma-70 n=1 Tax=Lampropedia aestuarii TaxID=2562762 RepID=A0A4S5BP12_9BURK|nr:anti-sigma factor [Lampropedia aestuarii]THJ31478.1 RNA polymerase subunit sigma-70 [Lampropedia aestuarii]
MSVDHTAPEVPLDAQEDDALQTLAGEYVLGTLTAAQRREVEARLPHNAALQNAILAWENRLLPLTKLVEPVQASPALWPRIAASTTAALAAHTAQRRTKVWWQWDSLSLWRSLAGSGFATAAILAGLLWSGAATPPAAARYFVVLAAPDNQSPGWLVQAQAANRLQLIPLGHEALPAEKSLQFWTKADGWRGPVSLGLVEPGEVLEIPVDQLPPLQPNQLFELTLEPAGGSPLDRPTGPIQFIGRAVQI